MNARPNTDTAFAAMPPNVQDALDALRNLVAPPVENTEAMFQLGAAAVFRTVAKTDPHWNHTIDAIDSIGEQAGLYDANQRQKLIDGGFEDAKNPAPQIAKTKPAAKPAAPPTISIITPADLENFFADWQEAIATAPDIPEKWAECIADVRGKMMGQEIGRTAAIAQLAVIADKLDLPAADLDARPPMNGHDAEPVPERGDYGTTSARLPATIDDTSAIAPAKFITPAAWPNEAPPPVDWLVASRIPRGDVTTLHGDGGAGKTDIALRLAANVARGASDWLAHEIAFGKVLFISGEEPERELRRRMWQHSLRDGYSLDVLADNFRLWIPDEIHDAAMAIADRYNSIMRPTRIMQEIAAAILELAPILVVVDNVAATFAGNQNDRVSVRSFVNLWRQIAHGPSKPAVLLLDHPSLSGLTSNTGRGGNMDWRNAVRSALWLHPPTEGAEADRGIRILETAKSNYGPPGNPLRLVWADGGLQLEHAQPSHHRAAKDAECEEAFLRLLDQREGQGRFVSGEAKATTYAAKAFADMPNNGGFTRNAFAAAMERLLQSGHIVQVMHGPPSRQRGHLVRKPAA
jgi:RecA-family ATPase